MPSTKLNGTSTDRRHRKNRLGTAAAIALLAGSTTMTMAASRADLRTSASRSPITATFNWQIFTPARLVHLDPPAGGGIGPLGNMSTEGLRAPAVGFAWQTYSPGHLVHLVPPNGSGASSSGNMQTDALRATAVRFDWQMFTPGHLVRSQPANGIDTSAPGGMHTDALRSAILHPTLVYGLDRTETGGFRAGMALSFRIP